MDPEIAALRSQEQGLRMFCARKQKTAQDWARLAQDDPKTYGDVARDAQSEADQCLEEADGIARRISELLRQKKTSFTAAAADAQAGPYWSQPFPVSQEAMQQTIRRPITTVPFGGLFAGGGTTFAGT